MAHPLRIRRNARRAGNYVARRNASRNAAHPAQRHSRVRSIGRWLAAPLATMALLLGMSFGTAPRANAQFSIAAIPILVNIFNFLKQVNTVCGQILGIENQMYSIRNQTLAPLSALSYARNLASTINGTYYAYLGSVRGMPVRFAITPTTQSLQSVMYGPAPGAIAAAYNNVWGAKPQTGAISSDLATSVDAGDAAANEVLALSAGSDVYASSINNAVTQISSQLATANNTPGSASIYIAQARLLELHSKVVQQRLLAAELRLRAASLAQKTAQLKAVARNNNSTMTGITGLVR